MSATVSFPAPSFRAQLRATALSVLTGNTIAGGNVYSSRDIELTTAQLPALILYTTVDRKKLQSTAGTVPRYDATTVLHIVGRVFHVGDDDSWNAEAQLDALVDGTITTLMTSTAFLIPDLWQVSDIDTDMEFRNDGGTLGQAVMGFHCRYVDEYDPSITQVLNTIAVSIDTGFPFDPNGAYVPKFPAPRVAGPDGRIEVPLTLAIPQS